MIVPIQNQKVRPRTDHKVTAPNRAQNRAPVRGPSVTLDFSLPRGGSASAAAGLLAGFGGLWQRLQQAGDTLTRLLRQAPFEYLPVVLAIPLLIVVLSSLSPVLLSGRDYRLPAFGLQFPADSKLTLLLLSATNIEEAFKEAETVESAQPQAQARQVKMLAVQKYTIKNGDSLSTVANQYGISLSTLINYNNIQNVRRITPGMELQVPNMDGILYTVRGGDSLSGIARRYKVDYDLVLDANNLETPVVTPNQKVFLPGASMSGWELKQALGELFIYPARGELTSRYGYRGDPFTGVRRFHNGIDIANVAGTPIRASMDGRVTDTGFHSSYGNYIVINHDRGFQTLYGHLRAFKVKRGQYVTQGQVIGQMGNTGYSTGTHVHFCVFKNNQHQDPLKVLH